MKLSIIIPAYNEEKRIGRTLEYYHQFFGSEEQQGNLNYEIVVVLNGCVDNTLAVVQKMRARYGHTQIVNVKEAGKGLAIAVGFANALQRDNDYIGFVDADMATAPQHFFKLMPHLQKIDGAIASRYMPGAQIKPQRPWIKRWGKRIFFDSLVRLLLGINYWDTQCGAKMFRRAAIEKIVQDMRVDHFAVDIDLLFLCKKYGFNVHEFPTVWRDQAGSKLRLLGSGLPMLSAVVRVRLAHSPFKRWLKKPTNKTITIHEE